ncbi:hypothetical protein QVD17_36871 [Tagetes erecta]|uniref:Uncharacterized protein n=1 Tax=Tagetes erecta TaxID=13708 RepID=A0AAD8JX52_TARER|nr:hypothetical protein QVD17_36871 [Tagetes erecta]
MLQCYGMIGGLTMTIECFCVPKLFTLEKQKACMISIRFEMVGNVVTWKWEWKRAPKQGVEESQLQILEDILSSFRLSTISNQWVWSGHETGEFTIKGLRLLLVQIWPWSAEIDYLETVSIRESLEFPWGSPLPGRSKEILNVWRASVW